MATFNELVTQQEQVAGQIEKSFENFKKEGKDRKTEVNLKKRAEQLEEAWAVFETQHEELETAVDFDAEHTYVKKKFYDRVTQLYNTFREKINLALKEAKIQSNSNPPETKEMQYFRAFKRLIAGLERVLLTIGGEPPFSNSYLQQKIKSINEYWTQISEHHRSLLILQTYDEEDYMAIEERYQEKLIWLQERLEEDKPPETAQEHTLKLPKIQVPIFDGNIIKWNEFKDLFHQIIHTQAIGSASKLYYLKANLSGEPSKLISHLPASGDHYQTAWNILTERYDNKRAIVTSLFNKLLGQPTVMTENSTSIRRLHDTSKECLLALENINPDINHPLHDALLVHLLLQKLDKESRRLYEQNIQTPRELQSLNSLLSFLETRFRMLEAIQPRDDKRKSTSLMLTEKQHNCSVCKSADHKIYNCGTFLKLPITERWQKVKQLNLCKNCLRSSHTVNQCSGGHCRNCEQKHNTLLHNSNNSQRSTQRISNKTRPTSSSHGHRGGNISQTQVARTPTSINIDDSTSAAVHQSNVAESLVHNTSLNTSSNSLTLLATAVVNVWNSQGNLVPCRALLDSGSQLSFITERLAHDLGLHRSRIHLPIFGIGGTSTTAKSKMELTIKSRFNQYTTSFEAVILPKINEFQPQDFIDASTWNIPEHIQLADPEFYNPGQIDMLIGADSYPDLLTTGKIKLDDELPVLQNSKLGWVVIGRLKLQSNPRYYSNVVSQTSLASLDKQVQRFWELEQHDPPSKRITKEEKECEDFFQTTVKRSSDGSFIVKLPFRENPSKLGESFNLAFKRFYSLERKLIKNPELKESYIRFMREYEDLGHMELFPLHEVPPNHFVIPHHCVLKPQSSSTKLRVVFDASAKTTSGVSLNNILRIGPTVQPDLFTILAKFRLHEYAFTTDITKMFRQIKVEKSDQSFQLILWRENDQEPVKVYKLNTVTYGTSCAPYLATRCLNKLAEEEAKVFPRAARALQSEMYVDDVLSGSDSIANARTLRIQLEDLLKRGNFCLSKFCANNPQIINDVPEDRREQMLQINDDDVIKTLGLIWNPIEDVFQFSSTLTDDQEKITKRIMLSEVSRLFDPLGLVGPVVVLGKLFIQELWKQKLGWDDPIPDEINNQWRKYKEQLINLKNLRVPRWVMLAQPSNIQLHAFSDSSNLAYGTCIYLRSTNEFGEVKCRLLCSRSKLAPLKTTTLARLELCGAVMMVESVERLMQIIPLKIDEVFYHTDSKTVLSWIASPSYSWNTFIANRVAKIQNLSQTNQWRHISGVLNPADIISRGMLPDQLQQSKNWFEGPEFLSQGPDYWPQSQCEVLAEIPEARPHKTILTVAEVTDISVHINHGNSYEKLLRIIAYCLRFRRNCNLYQRFRDRGSLTANELNTAEIAIARSIQQISFAKEYRQLSSGNQLDANSSLWSLSPYFDQADNILRVGGRLKFSNLEPDAKHQILIPKDHAVSKMLLHKLHMKNMHAAPQALMAAARQRFWIIDIRRLARNIVHDCIRCARCKPQTIDQYMAPLPKDRVRPSSPFYKTGVDFCGPIYINTKIRGKCLAKTYIAVFVCFTTKAIHLELASDLSTDAFLNALKRFISRRGLCKTLSCDNATNFLGASNALKEFRSLFQNEKFQESIIKMCLENRIEWKTIPPRTPHYGGLWEAAVKSAKHHLVRQVGLANLTYEEMHTVITQIEAILNSRPLTPISSDPNDLEALTPGHFLIGRPITSFPEPNVSFENINRLTRFRRLQHIHQNFWKRWSSEYLNLLQPRNKWLKVKPNINPGTLVVLKDENLPPLKWALGRVTEVFASPDELIRVVNVKTKTGIYKRAIHNLCPLPIDTNEPVIETPELPPVTTLKSVSDTTYHTKRKPNSEKNSTTTVESSHDSKPKRTKKPSSSKKMSLLSLALLTLLILPILAKNVEIQPFEQPPGIFYANKGRLGVINAKWSLLVYYDLEQYWLEADYLNKTASYLTSLCPIIKNLRVQCDGITKEFQQELRALNENNLILQDSTASKKARLRRSPFDIVGTVGNKLFGLLDAEYAKQIENTIREIKGNASHFTALLNQQTSVIDATLNVLKSEEEYINQRLEAITSHAKSVEQQQNNISKLIGDQQLIEAFHSISIQTSLALGSYRRIQDTLFDVIVTTRQGKISPYLLTPNQFQQELHIMREHMPSTSVLPVEAGKAEMLHLYQLVKARGRITESKAVFEIVIPLIENEQYELFHMIPVPMLAENMYHFIQLKTPYLGTSLHREKYVFMNDMDFMQCTISFDQTHLCEPPKQFQLSAEQQCIKQLLDHTNTNLPNVCELEPTPATTWFQRVQEENKWLYSVPIKTSITIVCPEGSLQEVLKNQGIITFNKDCATKVNGWTLTSSIQSSHSLRTSFVPALNFTMYHVTSIYQGQENRTSNLTYTQFNNSRAIQKLQDSIKQVQEKTETIPQVSHHDIHHYAVIYLIIYA